MKKILPFRPLFYLIFVLAFALVPLESIIDHSFCIYSNLLGVKCAGCGVTRGFCAFMHFDFSLSYSLNPVFTFSVFPITLFLMLEDTISIILRCFLKIQRFSVVEKGIKAFYKTIMGKK